MNTTLPSRLPFRVVVVAAAALMAYGLVLTGFAARGVDPLLLIQDPSDVPGRPAYAGLLSHIGILGWTAASAIALFAGCLAVVRPNDRARAGLLLAGGGLSLLLAVDDFFLLHDRVVPQVVAYGAHAGMALLIVGVFPRTLLRNGGAGVLIAGALLAGSIAIDVLQGRIPADYRMLQSIEEGLKFSGIACWAAAWIGLAATTLAESVGPSTSDPTGQLSA